MRRTKRGGWPYSQPPNVQFELNRASPQAKGLVAWWPTLASRGANVLRDLGGRGFNAVFAGNPTWLVDPKLGFVVDYDGAGDVAVISGEGLGTTSLTIAAWVRPRGDTESTFGGGPNGGSIFATREVDADRSPSLIWSAQDGQRRFLFTFDTAGAAQGAKGDTVLTLGTLYHVVGTFEYTGVGAHQGNWRVYVNGVPDHAGVSNFSLAGNVVMPFTGATWRIADENQWANQADGEIGDLRVYKRFFTPPEVWQLYANPRELCKPLVRRWVVGLPAPPPVGGHMTLWGRYWGP